jgi:hypothetical protein
MHCGKALQYCSFALHVALQCIALQEEGEEMKWREAVRLVANRAAVSLNVLTNSFCIRIELADGICREHNGKERLVHEQDLGLVHFDAQAHACAYAKVARHCHKGLLNSLIFCNSAASACGVARTTLLSSRLVTVLRRL